MDTRYETYYEVDINGVNAHLFITTHEHHTHDLIWQTEEAYFSFSCSYEVDPEELIRCFQRFIDRIQLFKVIVHVYPFRCV